MPYTYEGKYSEYEMGFWNVGASVRYILKKLESEEIISHFCTSFLYELLSGKKIEDALNVAINETVISSKHFFEAAVKLLLLNFYVDEIEQLENKSDLHSVEEKYKDLLICIKNSDSEIYHNDIISEALSNSGRENIGLFFKSVYKNLYKEFVIKKGIQSKCPSPSNYYGENGYKRINFE